MDGAFDDDSGIFFEKLGEGETSYEEADQEGGCGL